MAKVTGIRGREKKEAETGSGYITGVVSVVYIYKYVREVIMMMNAEMK